jgi:hypothetical protein
MHRSGTSATARLVNLLGADIASELMPAGQGDNDRGYWESPAVHDIHQGLLRELGSSWDDPFPLPDQWTKTSASQEAKRRLADEINKDFADSRLFVAKDPRVARLLPLWLEMLEELDVEPVVVIPFRNPLEVATSLERRDRLPTAQSMLVYIRSNLEAELASRRYRRVFIHYNELISDWQVFAEKFRKLIGPRGVLSPAESAVEISNFLTTDLHRNRSSRAQLLDVPDIAATVVEIYDRMVEAAETNDDAKLRPSFDRLRETVGEATRLYKGLVVAEHINSRDEIARLQSEWNTSEGCLNGEIVRLQSEWNASDGRLNAEVAQLRAKVSDVNAELKTQLSETTRLNDVLSLARAEAANLQAEILERSNEVSGLRNELGSARDEVARLEAALVDRQRMLGAMESSLSWRLTKPLRTIATIAALLARRIKILSLRGS